MIYYFSQSDSLSLFLCVGGGGGEGGVCLYLCLSLSQFVSLTPPGRALCSGH